jgi:hypothetical protein
MKAEIEGRPVAVFFNYGVQNMGTEKKPKLARFVKCHICPEREKDQEKVDPIATGIALCSPRDNFCKVIGRRHAFQKALDYAGFDRKTRTLLWEQFKQTHRYKL